ncbi:MFS transporter [Paenibacillus sp. 1011MAR3C5]|uniref:CynX/NimT family MFS transporter n=1 Tax=Paenibacillus sp. 1011MAR3C5 TaxID=1675787 RepID=UPI000E6CD481|nr:MFS transporter [Paenibacillus sp. 1011MAR3C5]RJE89843.1 MFS transporter [Paenibacillus sp. 1011MAR3C5]
MLNSDSQSVERKRTSSLKTSGNSGGPAWLLVLSIILVALVLRAPITTVGPIIDQIRLSMGLSGAMTGLLTTLPLLAFAIISPLAPRLAARIGMERALFYAASLLTAAIAVRSLPSVYALFLGTALLGAAIAIGNVLLPSLVKRDYPDKVGLMTGIYTVAMNLGAAIGSGISVPLTEGLGFSWQSTLAATALVAFLAAAIWLPLLRRNSLASSRDHAGKASASESHSSIRRKLWTSPLAWSVSLFLALQSFCFYVNVTWIPLILADKGISHADAGWLLSVMQLVGMPSTFLIPILAGKKASQRGLAMLTSSLFIAGYLILLLGSHSWALVSMIILGLGVGGGFGLALMFFALRASSTEQAAELSGMAQAVGYLLAASGPLLFGLIHDWTGGWNVPLILIIAISVLYGLLGLSAGADRKV